MTASAKVLIGHPTFNRSIESHGSAHSADTNYNGWRGEGMAGNEDIGTQTDGNAGGSGGGGSLTNSGRALFSEPRRRKEDAIVDISLESMKYNGGTDFLREREEFDLAFSNPDGSRDLPIANANI